MPRNVNPIIVDDAMYVVNDDGLLTCLDAKTGQHLWTFHVVPRDGEFGVDTWLNGSHKYSGNSGVWSLLSADEELGYVYLPMEEATGDFGRKMNSMPKYVASRTLREAEWNASIIEGDLADAVTALKRQSGNDLLIYGSGDLVDELTALGLIDEYRLMINPVVVGNGKRLFNGDTERTLRLDDTQTTGTGVVVVTYATTS